MVRPAIIQDLKAKAAGDPFALCTSCGNVPQWGGHGDWHWIECECGERSGQHLDPPDAKLEWNRAHA